MTNMTIGQMIGQSAIVTVLGMGAVFAFLIIMVFAMMGVHRLVVLFKLDKEDKPGVKGSTSASPQGAVVAAIAVSVLQNKK